MGVISKIPGSSRDGTKYWYKEPRPTFSNRHLSRVQSKFLACLEASWDPTLPVFSPCSSSSVSCLPLALSVFVSRHNAVHLSVLFALLFFPSHRLPPLTVPAHSSLLFILWDATQVDWKFHSRLPLPNPLHPPTPSPGVFFQWVYIWVSCDLPTPPSTRRKAFEDRTYIISISISSESQCLWLSRYSIKICSNALNIMFRVCVCVRERERERERFNPCLANNWPTLN